MNAYEFQQLYRRERLVLSGAFALLMVIVGVLAVLQNPDAFFVSTANAYEQATEVVSDVIRGIASR